MSLVVNIVLSNVLFDEANLAIWLEITVDSEISNLITAATFDFVVPKIDVIENHLSLDSILHIDTSPSLVSAGHFETVLHALKVPCARDLLSSLKHAIVEDDMLAKVLLLEVSHAVRFNVALKNELSDIIATLASEDLAWGSLELHPSHVMVFTILSVGALPDGIGVKEVSRWHWVRGRRDANRLRH